jgi:hypothetical protein
VSADSAMRVIGATLSRDNDMTLAWSGVQLLQLPVALHALGISDDSATLKLEVADASGTRTVTLATDTVQFFRKLLAPATAKSPAPLWLRRVTEMHWLTPLPELKAVYAQYNQVRNDPSESVAQFADKVAQSLRETKATNLIVDVRHNNGGNRSLNTPLLVTMAAFKRESPENRVYVITGRGTFSAAQVFISQAEWMVNPIFVGEPSSSRPNFVGEETGVVLPYSGMRGSVSNQIHQGSLFQDERTFIAPQIPVALSAVDYFANRDPVMNAITKLLTDSAARALTP